MKNLRIILYTFVVLIMASCQTNEDVLEIENAKTEIELQSKAGGINELDVATYNLVTFTYELGTTELEKKAIRATHGPIFGLITYSICPNNPYKEIWNITSATAIDLAAKVVSAEDEDDVDKVELGASCN